MSEQPTPRTDAIEPQCKIDTGGCEDWCCDYMPCPTCKGNVAVEIALNHSRQLERELATANEARAQIGPLKARIAELNALLAVFSGVRQ